MDQEKIKYSRKVARQVIKRMYDNDLPAEPDHYVTLYFYVSGQNTNVIEDINRIIKSKGKISSEDLMKIHETHFQRDAMSNEIDSVAHQLTDELGEILALIKHNSDATNKTTEDIEQAGVKLDNANSEEDVRAVITGLASAVADIKSNNAALQDRLNESQKQVANLQGDLESMRAEVNIDALTTLANRKFFDQTMNNMVDAAKSDDERVSGFCLLMMDIDHFKSFNDNYGHQTGDHVIRLVAQAIKNSIKGQDFAARYGGEEFAVVLPNTKINGAVSLADNIRNAVMAKELVKKSTSQKLGRITISIGAAEFSLETDTVSSIIERADAALYEAKKSGRNCVKVAN